MANIYRLNTKIRLTGLSGFELYSRWVPLRKLPRCLRRRSCRLTFFVAGKNVAYHFKILHASAA